ncbi:hypothetical protein M0812_26374 [Anaeramoeba flamelloides]|uniref:Uncharacterized protein n=1 Tax=Anaeramoeba flamelloides TaxID=1746091 RepID=A0AAV7YE09_9EUKA|nr:hypothetical protein M0812_26374 [Anaeramoeba flamelloides]
MTYLSKNRFVTDLSKTTLSPQCCSIEWCQENTTKWCHLSKLKFCQKHSNTHHTLDSYKVHKVESYKHQDFGYCPKHRRRYTRQDIETTELFCDECLLYEKKYYNRKVQTFWNIEEAADYCVSASQITKTKLCNKTLRY